MTLFIVERKYNMNEITLFISYHICLNNYKCYLEIGIRNPNDNFNNIKIPCKDNRVDSASNCNYLITSDNFYIIVFINYVHLKYQALRDIGNSLTKLNENGTIVIHDRNPFMENHKSNTYNGGTWVGTLWKAFDLLRMSRPDLCMCTDIR
jgi:hypothetical protein